MWIQLLWENISQLARLDENHSSREFVFFRFSSPLHLLCLPSFFISPSPPSPSASSSCPDRLILDSMFLEAVGGEGGAGGNGGHGGAGGRGRDATEAGAKGLVCRILFFFLFFFFFSSFFFSFPFFFFLKNHFLCPFPPAKVGVAEAAARVATGALAATVATFASNSAQKTG